MMVRSILVAVLVVACSASADEEVVVSAAASLTDAFGEMEAAFERANPGVDVVLNLGPSSGLREQILEGAPVDVFAPADQAHMDPVVSGGAASDPRVFAHNRLQIAVPAGNPAGVTDLDDLAREELVVGLCAPQVPCGDLARRALASAGITPVVDTNEPDVRALLTKLAAGELDVGITYATDVAAEEEVGGIDLPARHQVVARYPITVLGDAPNPEAAEAFVAFVLSERGRSILSRWGFEAP